MTTIFFIPFIAALLAATLPGSRMKKAVALLGALSALAYPIGTLGLHLVVTPSVLNTNLAFLLSVDRLSLLFALLIGLISLLSTIFSFSYVKEKEGYYYGFLLAFIGAMQGTVLAGNFITLFFFWELMTAASFFLIIFERTRETEQAAKKYFLMTGLCSLVMLFAIFGLHFAWEITGATYNLFLMAFLVSAGVKAGIVPLHSWLPEAHPAAPSPVSALLSGIMIKVGIYLLIRVLYPLFMPGLNWQFFLALLGTITILFGVFNALAQHDFKRLLAYHSISQVGYILLGIATLSGLGLTGGLMHVINHGLFKSLLFLVSGVLISVYGVRDLEKISGLYRKLPLTFWACLVASLSISGVPPFNGFVSKWIIYQALVNKGTPDAYLFLTAALFGSALTLASFLKVLSGIFFGPYRAPAPLVPERVERGFSFGFPMVTLSLLCIVLGVWPGVILNTIINPVIATLFEAPVFPGFYQPHLVSVLMLLGLVLGLLLYRFSRTKVRRTRIYIGGEETTEEMRYPATQYYGTMEKGPLAAYYARERAGSFDVYYLGIRVKDTGARFFAALTELDSWLVKPMLALLDRIKVSLQQAHNGMLPRYIFWVFIGLLVLLFIF